LLTLSGHAGYNPLRSLLCIALLGLDIQGQSFTHVRDELRVLSFIDGQLYVSLSQLKDVSRLSVLLKKGNDTVVNNVVYPVALI
jgi:hypothetical protein